MIQIFPPYILMRILPMTTERGKTNKGPEERSKGDYVCI